MHDPVFFSSETFTFHRMTGVICLTLAAILFCQPQWVGGPYRQVPPMFTFDTLFAFPVSSNPFADGSSVYEQCRQATVMMTASSSGLASCSYDLIGILSMVLSPVVGAYSLILVCICKGVHVGAVMLWMGLGGISASVFGGFNILNATYVNCKFSG